jgi:2-polyprenyl-3-methyl-5-hydroxy-6-metoxy-1,4-benzoquinol methylase
LSWTKVSQKERELKRMGRQYKGSGPHSRLLQFVDHSETYGPRIVQGYLRQLPNITTAVDVGAGAGRDLGLVKERFPAASLSAIEYMPQYNKNMNEQGIAVHNLDIEKDTLPFKNESIDLIICNQILEHTKQLFWIFHEFSRVIKIGGYIIVGVPNVANLHNRIGLLFGKHPTQAKICSAHIRCFSKNDFLLFLQECFPGGYTVQNFAGSQFYPFPDFLARPLSRYLPSMAFSIFFLLKKSCKKYTGQFLEYPERAALETNFWLGRAIAQGESTPRKTPPSA